MNRRTFTGFLASTFVASPIIARTAFPERGLNHIIDRCSVLEASLGGRLGVSCIDAETGRAFGYRRDERFPMCSTFKWLAAAAVLDTVDAGRENLERRVRIDATDLMEWSPVTKQFVGAADGMTLAQLCDAAITTSDNPAAAKLLNSIGGISAFNRYLRRIGDEVTRLDRGEPSLNEALPGDVRDTTSPAAMSSNLQRLLLGDSLKPSSRKDLTEWMLGAKYSGKRLRADLPAGWRLADKTGTGNTGTGAASDVGVYWPTKGAPVVLSVYIKEARVSLDKQEAAIATVGSWVYELA